MVDTAVPVALSIGQVAALTGLSVHTLRLYEREGLFAGDVQRDSAGRRAYTQVDVDWLTMCLRLRSSGMPIATIRRYAELVRAGGGNEAERLLLLKNHEQEIERRLAELAECHAVITAKVRTYESHLGTGSSGEPWPGPRGASHDA